MEVKSWRHGVDLDMIGCQEMVRGSNPVGLAQPPSGGMKFHLPGRSNILSRQIQMKAAVMDCKQCVLLITKEPDGSAVKSTYCSCKGTQVQFPATTLGGSQIPITPTSRDPTSTFDHNGTALTHAHSHTQTYTHDI